MSAGFHNNPRFTLGQPLNLDETRWLELKEVKGANPVSAIVNAADEYAVAFLNSEGGQVYWGVRDTDRVVVGVPLSPEQRDRLRRDVNSKLHAIQPQIDPTRFSLQIHPVDSGGSDRDLFIVELLVPRLTSDEPFYTGGHDAFVRVDGVRKKLSGPQLTAWITARLKAGNAPATSVDTPGVLELVGRIRRIFAAHGLEPAHLARFFNLQKAPFTFALTDIQTDGALLTWLTEEKIQWIAQTFLVRREWIDGEDTRIYEEQSFDKQPKDFFATVSQHVDSLIWEDVHATPEAYFIRWGKGKEWRTKGESGVFVVLAVPLARFSNDRIVYKYISDFQAHSWDYGRTQIQLRAWARLLSLNKRIPCHGREVPYTIGAGLASNTIFLYDLIEDRGPLAKIDWHPEDYALASNESAAAKDVENLPHVLQFLRSNGLPWEPANLRPR